MSTNLPRLIAITGQEGSGKDSYGDYLASLGYVHVSAGDFLRNEARKQGYKDPLSREILSQIGDRLKEELGPSPIVESTLRQYGDAKHGIVISGLRRTGELEALKRHDGVVLWVDADIERRFANQNSRARGDHQDKSRFVEHGKKEYQGATRGGNQGVNIMAVEQMADCRVANNGTLEDLYRNADQALSSFAR